MDSFKLPAARAWSKLVCACVCAVLLSLCAGAAQQQLDAVGCCCWRQRRGSQPQQAWSSSHDGSSWPLGLCSKGNPTCCAATQLSAS